MDKQYLHEKLAGLRNKYVESANEETNAGFLDEAKNLTDRKSVV